MLTHRSIINNGKYANRTGIVGENDVVLIPLPFFYIYSITHVIVEPLVYGYKIVVLENFDPLKCLEVIQSEGCNSIWAVPTIYMALIHHPRFNAFNTKSIKYGCIGGAVCPQELMKIIMDKMHLKSMYLAYGLTETASVVTDFIVEDPADPRLVTVGVPIPGVEVSIRDPDNHREYPVDTHGEICVKGFNVMTGYYKIEEATGEAIDKDGWFHTGDLGHLLSSGDLVLDGRIKELIIRGGENIYPKEVENLLLAIPGIQDVQVAGIPSKKYGEEVAAFIILKQGMGQVTEKEVIEYCKERISLYKTPKYVFFVDSFPLSGSGKVQKFRLSELGFNTIQEKGIAT
ncbi:hypothetical protein AGMMS4952_21570 [Spirochaetia bacterium]|nr:hypothetical protein AGMMS4952_21570 [Spirochaetia bacterium]